LKLFEEMVRNQSLVKYRIGASSEVLTEIRSWNYGVLILDKSEGTGINTRFAKDAIVMITCKVDSIAEYH
jgi:hypothetical protein